MAEDLVLSKSDDLHWYQASGIVAVQTTPLVTRDGQIIGMISTHWKHRHRPGERELVHFDILARQAADLIERRVAESALRESQERLQAAFQSVPVGVAVIDLGGKVLTANAEYRRFLPSGAIPSRDPERINRWRAWNQHGKPIDPQDWPGARALRGEAVVPGLDMLFTADDGREIWTRVATVPTRDKGGKVTGAVSTITDVDAARRSEEALRDSERHAQILLQELQHRVRNTLAVVRSIARRTAETSQSAEDMLAHFQGRLDAFSRVQSALTRNPDGRVNLASLIEDELVAHAAREGEELVIEGPEVSLEARTAERISLAIHELTTNAVKYGALANGSGRLRVSWSTEADGEGNALPLQWRESGVELIDRKMKRQGFGMELLRRTLPYDLQGETKVELEPDGLRFELKAPLAAAHG